MIWLHGLGSGVKHPIADDWNRFAACGMISRSYFIHWIRFRSGNAIWIKRQKSLSSVGSAN